MIDLNELADALTLAAQAQARLPALEQALESETRRADGLTNDVRNLHEQVAVLQGHIDAQAAALEEARVIQAALREQIAALMKPPTPEPVQRAAFAVDPAFTPDVLDSERRAWYDRLIVTFGAVKPYPDAYANFAGMGNAAADYPYALGYDQSAYVLAMALDATGDPVLLDEIAQRMKLINHSRLPYATALKESYIIRLFAFYTYLLHINGRDDAAWWLDVTLARIREHGGIVGNDDLAQCVVNRTLTAWCLWLVTGDTAWRDSAEASRDDFFARFVTDRERCIWLHSAQNPHWLGDARQQIWLLPRQIPPGFPSEPMGAQWADYARYDMAALLILHKLDCTVFAPELLAARVRDMYRAPGNVSFRMDGTDLRNPQTGETFAWNKGDMGWIISSYVLCGGWDDDVRAVSLAAWERTSDHDKLPFVPAAMVCQR